MTDRLAELSAAGVRHLRITYSDLYGIARGKEVPMSAAAGACEHGVGFCESINAIDLRHNVLSGEEHGFRDIAAVADLETAVVLPWDPTTATCIADLVRTPGHEPYESDTRAVVKRAIEGFGELGYTPIVAPEMEFFLIRRRSDGAYERPLNDPSCVYTVGSAADPGGVVREMVEACEAMGLEPVSSSQEFGMSQYEINVRHSPALQAADRAFRLKAVVKEIAARHGLIATFMGQPWNDDHTGSGFHVHFSLVDALGKNMFADSSDEHGLSAVARHFAAGVLEHVLSLSAILNPTVNAYKRIFPESLAPTHVNWGYDNRLALGRFPSERGAATRFEVRSPDGSACPHLVIGSLLHAGLDGVRRELELPEPVVGNPYAADEAEWGPALPSCLDDALELLAANETMAAALNPALIRTFSAEKRAELDRWHAHMRQITRWELDEYAFWL